MNTFYLFQGMDLYFKRHDGQAVTCEDFFAAMRDANDADLSNFLLWYVVFAFISLLMVSGENHLTMWIVVHNG